jgi:hypothetical protein
LRNNTGVDLSNGGVLFFSVDVTEFEMLKMMDLHSKSIESVIQNHNREKNEGESWKRDCWPGRREWGHLTGQRSPNGCVSPRDWCKLHYLCFLVFSFVGRIRFWSPRWWESNIHGARYCVSDRTGWIGSAWSSQNERNGKGARCPSSDSEWIWECCESPRSDLLNSLTTTGWRCRRGVGDRREIQIGRIELRNLKLFDLNVV